MRDGGTYEAFDKNPCIDDYALSACEPEPFRSAGGNAIIDVQPVGAGRKSRSLRTLSKETGVKIVASTGFHMRKFYPAESRIYALSAGEARALFVGELTEGIPYFAGCCTPTEIIMCITRGYEVVKFFPAKQYGGVDTIKALAAPFPGLKFMPTGGVNASNIKDYLACDKVIACGGSWMVDGKLVAAGKFDEIEKLVKEAVAAVK